MELKPCCKCMYCDYCCECKTLENVVVDRLIKVWVLNEDCFVEVEGDG